MRTAAVLLFSLLASAALAAEQKTFHFACKGGDFAVTTTIDRSKGCEQWSRSEPLVLQIAGEPPQTLASDPNEPDADSYKNKDYEFYALKSFITLTRKSHGVVVKHYDACK